MKHESGRSLIEIIGVLAISAIMVSATFTMFRTVVQRQKRLIASETLNDIVSKTRTLLEYSGYAPVSVEFLIQSGALTNAKAPLGSSDWSITPSFDATEFSINLNGLSYEECTYFTTKKFDWVEHISVNGYSTGEASLCIKLGENKISMFAK